jgi:hypothetical protein
MKKIIIIFFFTIPMLSWSQPGYMGKKFSVGYEFELMPWLCSLTRTKEYFHKSGNSFDEFSKENTIQWVTGHHLNANYVTSRKHEVFVNSSMRQMTYYWNSTKIDGYGNFSPFVPSISALETYIDIGVRYYPSDFIAPIGLYHQFSYGFCNVMLDSKVKSVDGLSFGDIFTNVAVTDAKYKTHRLNYGFGVKRIIAGPVFLNADVNFHIPLQTSENRKLSKTGASVEYKDFALHNILINYNSYKLIDMRMGIGVLF